MANHNIWGFSGDTWTQLGNSTDFANLPTPDSDDEFFRGKPLVFYNMETKIAYIYDYVSKTWMAQ